MLKNIYINIYNFLIEFLSIAVLKSKVMLLPAQTWNSIVLVSSGIDFVNTPRLYSNRANR